MATLALSVAGQVAGGLIGGPIGAMLGRALGALAGSAVDNAIFGDKPAASAITSGSDLRLQGSAEGGAIPRLYGWSRLTGNIIWATQLEESTQQSSGAKGTSNSASTNTIFANFAVALCEGEVHRLGRIWADGELLETDALNFRFHRGSEDQLPDSLIVAKQGEGNAPAYRGLCYLVFEGLDLTPFGNRIPNLSVELCRVVGELEPAIRAVTVIPGATEFGYDPSPRVRLVSPGATGNENAHVYPHVSDWTLSLDELQALCPNLEHVSLVVAWFGDDLRCDECTIAPRVEASSRDVEGPDWVVGGLGRGEARVVSQVDGKPAYGGTPSDASVLAAIADLKARGLKVTLYPMLLMDIPAENALIDPRTGTAGQPAYPWRGDITCAPAPGRPGTPDRTADADASLEAFLGAAAATEFTPLGTTIVYAGPVDWGYRRMQLHYAFLAGLAGGVDALLIGSELRGLTRVRGDGNAFPFVAALATLANDIRAVVGLDTKLTYGADWSEFSGYQPPDAPGDKFFHLDALWASPAIDALGLDNYMPLADWRDGSDHADAGVADTPYEAGYLRRNIAGGEGFDWYYASDADRFAGARSPISDGAYGEPWVFRYKDLAAWWSNPHYDRADGVRATTSTAWTPKSKPIWFTELGCPAVDKAANQPNVFPDVKSAAGGRPHFSNGAPDPLAQRQVLRAHLGRWCAVAGDFAEAQNPASDLYDGRMVDSDRLYLWTWDARPYPAFPNAADLWADSLNYAAGHWLTGRLGAMASDELVKAVAADFGVDIAAAGAMPPLVFGLDAETIATARDVLQPLLDASGLAVRDSATGLVFAHASQRLAASVAATELVALDGPLASRKRPDPSEALGRIALGYADRERDYLAGTVTALRLAQGATGGANTPLVLDLAGARGAAELMLAEGSTAREMLDVALPPSLAALEVGDTLAIGRQGDGPFVIASLRDGAARRASLQALAPATSAAIVADRPLPLATTTRPRALPVVAAAHLPGDPATPGNSQLVFAASSSPWPGEVLIDDAATGVELVRLMRKASLGTLLSPFAAGPLAVWDEATQLEVSLYSGHLAATDELAVLAGANRLAIKTDSGEWEIVGFADAELTGPSTYRLTHLLRGQGGTAHAVGPAAAGNCVIVLDTAVSPETVPVDWLGETLAFRAYAGTADPTGAALNIAVDRSPALPLAPVHLRARREPEGDDIMLSWMRCSRSDTNSWSTIDAPLDLSPEAYTVTVYDGTTPKRVLSANVPAVTYGSADQFADFGSLPASFTFTIAQLSPVLGPGLAATGAFNG